MSRINRLDAHQKPPERMRSLFKKYQKCKAEALDLDASIIDMQRAADVRGDQVIAAPEPCIAARDFAFQEFLSVPFDGHSQKRAEITPTSAFEVPGIPGLYFLPQLLPTDVQLAILQRLLHRDLSNDNHQTNLHQHYDVSYPPQSPPDPPASFFSLDKTVSFSPKDPAIHRPVSIAEFLGRKLRWMTLGGQYDWTAKTYPSRPPPPFPADMKLLLKRLFPEMDAQAAIVNIYSPGDTLSIHRDVSEECDQGLVSISLGCHGIFVVGNQDCTETAALRLRSGDAIYMTGSSRHAWHGVPRVIPNTCPDWLANWPAISDHEKQYDQWQGWMHNKRINLNVRQIRLDS